VATYSSRLRVLSLCAFVNAWTAVLSDTRFYLFTEKYTLKKYQINQKCDQIKCVRLVKDIYRVETGQTDMATLWAEKLPSACYILIPSNCYILSLPAAYFRMSTVTYFPTNLVTYFTTNLLYPFIYYFTLTLKQHLNFIFLLIVGVKHI